MASPLSEVALPEPAAILAEVRSTIPSVRPPSNDDEWARRFFEQPGEDIRQKNLRLGARFLRDRAAALAAHTAATQHAAQPVPANAAAGPSLLSTAEATRRRPRHPLSELHDVPEPEHVHSPDDFEQWPLTVSPPAQFYINPFLN
jgi:hypothetical protein